MCVGGGGAVCCRMSHVHCCLSFCLSFCRYLPACQCVHLPLLVPGWSDKCVLRHCAVLRGVLRVVCCVVLRALVFVSKFFGGVVPTPCEKGADKAAELGASVSERLHEYLAAMEKVSRERVIKGSGFGLLPSTLRVFA